MIGKVGTISAAAMLLTLGAGAATAQDSGALTSSIELERSTSAADGQPAKKTYVAPDVVVPGDRVRVTLTFTNRGTAAASGVNLVNPIPEGLAYDGTDDTAGFGVSIDAGKNFGPLADLAIPVEGSVPRPATTADVTHVRWLWSDAIAPGESRSVAFFGRVR